MPRVRVIKVQPEQSSEKAETTAIESAPVQADSPTATESKNPEPIPEELKQPFTDQVASNGDGIVISKKGLIRIILAIIILLLLVVAFVNRETPKPNNVSNQKSGQTEAQKYEEELSKLVDLPQGKTPTFSTVDDASKLASKSPTLFKNAQNGDVFLVYINDDKSGKVVLYRPSTKKIILFIDGVDLGQQNTNPNR